MKTKLLKKVRKRFSIERIDKIASDADNYTRVCKEVYGLPMFRVRDRNAFFDYKMKIFPNMVEAMVYLHKLIIKAYGEKFRHKDEVSQKVWYNQ